MGNVIAIALLLGVVTFVLRRLPRVDLGHSDTFLRRRILNWVPLGVTYGFLYMGRYNINAAKNAGVMTNEELGVITFWGALVYGLSFVVNGPLADKFGGRRTILIAALGAAAMNIALGWLVFTGQSSNVALFSLLYAGNMYFQSFGAVSIVKVNSHWFHVRERGTFGGIFGILISLGLYFAFDWGRLIAEHLPPAWVFFIPAGILLVMFFADFFLVFDTPSHTGHPDFDTADASSGDDGPRLGVWQLAKRMATNPVIVVIGLIEFCSGFVRVGVMKWTYVFLKETSPDAFVYNNWGLLLCCAGILGGVFAGAVSDRVFQSRRGPSAGILYAFVTLGLVASWLLLASPLVAWVLLIVMLSIIGVHGMLSGTASMDFGGRKNVGLAVGLIDGMVYLGVATQAIILGYLLPEGDAQKVAANWDSWIIVLIPAGVVGLALCSLIWNARPTPKRPA